MAWRGVKWKGCNVMSEGSPCQKWRLGWGVTGGVESNHSEAAAR